MRTASGRGLVARLRPPIMDKAGCGWTFPDRADAGDHRHVRNQRDRARRVFFLAERLCGGVPMKKPKPPARDDAARGDMGRDGPARDAVLGDVGATAHRGAAQSDPAVARELAELSATSADAAGTATIKSTATGGGETVLPTNGTAAGAADAEARGAYGGSLEGEA